MTIAVELIRSWTNEYGRKYPIGQRIKGDRKLTDRLIAEGYAKRYNGDPFSKHKVKTNFFKP